MAMIKLLLVITSLMTTIQAVHINKLPPSALSIYKPSAGNESFASTYELKDGEVITKLRWKNYSAIETRYLHIDLIQVSRTKRDSLLFPGTKWCGKGSNGKVFEDLGDYSFADRCCRDHDRCKYSIGPFENQYHLFNYR
ncbi:Phospholipase A2 venom-like protein [Euroglyphus maynei]|uniref:Phospholipase A2 venom-like protein n=1 Tax=Euroglyphus maynei TaxID=6958 RepID=A0A1Y3B979_EURMA|nr:Phospholipase A2 venom-like protein [Euroglyphus maynei]